jgi:hypothetical protein
MSAVCRNAKPESSLRAGHTYVNMSLSDDAITHRHRQTGIDTHSHTGNKLHTQTLDKFCNVRQKDTTDKE